MPKIFKRYFSKNDDTSSCNWSQHGPLVYLEETISKMKIPFQNCFWVDTILNNLVCACVCVCVCMFGKIGLQREAHSILTQLFITFVSTSIKFFTTSKCQSQCLVSSVIFVSNKSICFDFCLTFILTSCLWKALYYPSDGMALHCIHITCICSEI